MEYLDKVLIKLKRKYSKDDTVKALSKKLETLEFENGVLTSERDEFKYNSDLYLKTLKKYKQLKTTFNKKVDEVRLLKVEKRLLESENLNLKSKF